MFSIYGISGQTFRGTLEHMPLVSAVRPSMHTRGINQEGEKGSVQTNIPFNLDAIAPHAHEQAVATYRSMLPQELERGPLYHARQVMHAPVITARDDDPVELVWQLLIKHNIRQVPVLDSALRLVGLVHDHDLLTVLNVDHDQLRDVLKRTASDVMHTPVATADLVTDIRRIARVILSYGQGGVPILDERENMVGFVSRGDILRAVTTDPPLSLWV